MNTDEEKKLLSQCLDLIKMYREGEQQRHETVGKELSQMREVLARMDARSHTTPCEHLLNHIEQNRQEMSEFFDKFHGHCNDGHAGRISETVQDQRITRTEGQNYVKDLLGMAFKTVGVLLGLAGVIFTVLKISGKI